MSLSGLVHIYVPSMEGLNGLKRSAFNLRKFFHLPKASLIYKRFSAAHQRLQIEAVIKIETSEEGIELRSLQRELKQFNATILLVKGQLRVDPEITLPHPALLQDPFLLKMAAEVEPYWEHRVSMETLQGLVSQFPSTDQAELLTQGSELINLTIKGLS
jgi:7,8-dihydro-6-hydroxymethylpterin-pyrophosphokinase